MEAFGTFLPLILIFVVFYFLLIRPQQRKVKQHKEMLSNLKRGDKIVTSGGIIGTINKVADNRELTLQVADNVEIRNAIKIDVKVQNKVKFKLLYDNSKSLQKKIKLEQLIKETS